MTKRIAFSMIVMTALAVSSHAAAPFPEFNVQEIDKSLKVGYALKIVDLNNDGKPDIVVADAARVIWFDNAGGWKLHTIIDNAKAGVKGDNVCLDVADIDGDGKPDVALGADWQINNTTSGGSLQWLKQPADIDQPWTVHKIADPIPTLHRIRFFNFDERAARPELIVTPLKGRGTTAGKNWSEHPVEILRFPIPAHPETDRWQPAVLDASLHVVHNFYPTDIGSGLYIPAIFTASYEGVGVLREPQAGGEFHWELLDAGNQDTPAGSRGASEIKRWGFGNLATIEPFHGHQVVAYFKGKRHVIDDQLKGGHALWCADLDGDGIEEIVAGSRESTRSGAGPGINVYKVSGGGAAGPIDPDNWQKHVLDDKGIACEDLACADLNGDGRIDIVACGRATRNVRIYWNLSAPKP